MNGFDSQVQLNHQFIFKDVCFCDAAINRGYAEKGLLGNSSWT